MDRETSLTFADVTNLDAPADITAVGSRLSEYSSGEPWAYLGNYAYYVKQTLLPVWEGEPIDSTSCFGIHKQAFYAATTNSASRSYLYSICTSTRRLPSRSSIIPSPSSG